MTSLCSLPVWRDQFVSSGDVPRSGTEALSLTSEEALSGCCMRGLCVKETGVQGKVVVILCDCCVDGLKMLCG